MKKNITIRAQALFAFALGMHIISAYGCPTCVGRLSKDSPAFFAQDYADSSKTNQIAANTQTNSSTAFSGHAQESATLPGAAKEHATESGNSQAKMPQENN